MPGSWAFGCLHFVWQSWYFGEPRAPHTRACTPHPATISCSWFPDVVLGFLVPLLTVLFPSALTSFFSYLLELSQDGFVQTSAMF